MSSYTKSLCAELDALEMKWRFLDEDAANTVEEASRQIRQQQQQIAKERDQSGIIAKIEWVEPWYIDCVQGRIPCGRKCALKVTVGRLSCGGGFWPFGLHKLPSFFWAKCYGSSIGGQVRVWRFMGGACWERKQ